MVQKFKPGDKVKHVDGTEPMRIVKYETEEKLNLGFSLNSNPLATKQEPTGYVICSWLMAGNMRTEGRFPEIELVKVN